MKTLSIVIPAYNEGKTIHLILDKVKAVKLIGGLQKEVIIVNDCSKDDTEEAIKRYQDSNPDMHIQYFKHEVNQGKGAALHTGIRIATGDMVIIQDADLEYLFFAYGECRFTAAASWADAPIEFFSSGILSGISS